jgi:2-pyrone-4,6-dicarboxylate lactonase
MSGEDRMPKLPAGACNAHCHVFGPAPRFPYAFRIAPLADNPKEALFTLNDRLGFERCVVVQSKVHSFDNSATEDAIAARPATYRGVGLLAPDVGDGELRRLDLAGFRGVRFNYMSHLGEQEPVERVLALAERIAPLGWHLQIHGEPERVLRAIVPRLLDGPVPVVIDHIGRLDAGLGLDQPLFTALRKLMERPDCWVKVSGIDRITAAGPPYADALPFARALVAEHPDRVVWGNDWPHPNHQGPPPDDNVLAALIHDIAPSTGELQALLVDNPARLYRFGDVTT